MTLPVPRKTTTKLAVAEFHELALSDRKRRQETSGERGRRGRDDICDAYMRAGVA